MTSTIENEKATAADSSSMSLHSQHEVKDTSTSSNSLSDDIEPGISPTPTKAVKHPNVVDWEGPLDPQNPLNWATSKKVTAIALVASITFLSSVSQLALTRLSQHAELADTRIGL